MTSVTVGAPPTESGMNNPDHTRYRLDNIRKNNESREKRVAGATKTYKTINRSNSAFVGSRLER